MSLSWIKVPAIIASSLICLAAGVGVGVAVMVVFGYQMSPPAEAAPPELPRGMGGSGGRMMPGMPGGGGPPGMGGFGRGPNAKAQLATLVAKLDQLTGKPLTVRLSDEQRKKVREQLEGLEGKDELKEDEAKQKLDALLELVKDQMDTLEAAGYRRPGERPTPPRPPGGGDGNPFKDDPNRQHLQSLQGRLAETKAN